MIDFLGQVVDFVTDPELWSGRNGIPGRTLEHTWLAVLPTAIAVAVAIPPAIWLAHRRRAQFLSTAFANIGRAVPSFGILVTAVVVLAYFGVSIRFWPAVIALVALAIPPMFTNAYAAIVNVPEAVVESARGMGFAESAVLRRIELPVGAPVILAGVEISFVQVIATVPLAAIVSSGGGLGQYVVRGFAQGAGGRAQAFVGAVLVALLTVVLQRAFSLGEDLLLPDGIKHLMRRRDRPLHRAT